MHPMLTAFDEMSPVTSMKQPSSNATPNWLDEQLLLLLLQ
jgi:hypothetical protein